MNKLFILLTIILIALFSIFLVAFLQYKPNGFELKDNIVLDIIDGDTFVLGNGENVRLICVDSPEQGEKGYEEAKEFLSGLILNKQVQLEKDVSETDEYGRLLRYVYLFQNETKIFVNKEIVRQGFGELFPYGNDTKRCGEIAEENVPF